MKPPRLAMSTGGSLISAVLSFIPLSCCAFPSAFSFLAVGGLASATALMPYRPYFVALTFVFLGAGFYFAYWPPRQYPLANSACAMRKSRTLQRGSLWLVAFATIVLIAFPYLLPFL